MKLREGETIIHRGRPHWIVFGWAILLGLLSARLMLCADLATSREARQVCLTIAGMLALYALGAACVAQLYRWSSRLILSNRRVVLKRGILRQRSSEFLLRTIESVLVQFPLSGRLFNYGTLTVLGFGGAARRLRCPPRTFFASPSTLRVLQHSRTKPRWYTNSISQQPTKPQKRPSGAPCAVTGRVFPACRMPEKSGT